MKKKVILLLLLVIIFAVCFIPVTQQKTISVKAPFLNVYRHLSNPINWKRWRPDLKKHLLTDSGKINVQKDTNSFTIKYKKQELSVKSGGSVFTIKDNFNNKTIKYDYIVIPDTLPNKTFITVNKNTSLINFLIGKLWPVSFSDTHIWDFKHFMETDSLYYGYAIFKTRVPESFLIEIKKEVLEKNKFTEAAKMLITLQQYAKTHHVKQVQPLIAQFISATKDSTQVNIGFYIDKETKSENNIYFARMPKGGPLYAAKFKGKFAERQKVYTALNQYFRDHLYQSAILPFETYLDNKLPVSDTDHVNIQVNFTAFF